MGREAEPGNGRPSIEAPTACFLPMETPQGRPSDWSTAPARESTVHNPMSRTRLTSLTLKELRIKPVAMERRILGTPSRCHQSRPMLHAPICSIQLGSSSTRRDLGRLHRINWLAKIGVHRNRLQTPSAKRRLVQRHRELKTSPWRNAVNHLHTSTHLIHHDTDKRKTNSGASSLA